MRAHFITMPNGRPVTVSTYARAWHTLKQMRPEQLVSGFYDFPEPAAMILAAMRSGLHDRINRHAPDYGRGRNWSSDQQRQMYADARTANSRSARKMFYSAVMRRRIQQEASR